MNLATTYVVSPAGLLIDGIQWMLPVHVSLVLFMLGQRRPAIVLMHLGSAVFVIRAVGASLWGTGPGEELRTLLWALRVRLSADSLWDLGFPFLQLMYLGGLASMILFHGALLFRPSRKVILAWWEPAPRKAVPDDDASATRPPQGE